jgi:hypothetical protein
MALTQSKVIADGSDGIEEEEMYRVDVSELPVVASERAAVA